MAASIKNHFVSAAVVAVLTLTLTACGDSSTEVGDSKAASTATNASNRQVRDLPIGPINLAEAYAPLSAGSKTVPVCPWLSDASANAAVDVPMTTDPMLRRAVTSSECKWNVNLGFALTIRSVPLAEAVSPSNVNYNMDIPPVLEPQDGPGSEAVAILNPTWDAAKPRPFAFIFNADDRQFKITTTGVKTSIERLRAVADEIAGALPTAAAVVEIKDAEPTLDPCVYDEAAVVALFGGDANSAETAQAHMPTSSCKYRGTVGNGSVELSINFGGDPLDPPNRFDAEYLPVDGFDADVYMKDASRTAGYMSTARFYKIARPSGQIMIYIKFPEETFPVDTAEQILKNLIARTN